jgi:hypothetical protein
MDIGWPAVQAKLNYIPLQSNETILSMRVYLEAEQWDLNKHIYAPDISLPL